jgi:hypothetical protein
MAVRILRRLFGLLILSAATGALAQTAITNTRGLSFGKFATSYIAGSVQVDTNGARIRSGGVVLLSSGPGAAASFSVSDTDPANVNKSYIITLPANDTVMLTSGAHNMPINNFVSYPSSGALNSGSQLLLSVGATLSVGPNQAPGNYSGTFVVTVNYQ